MPRMQTQLFRGVYTIGGSISRLPEQIYGEAAHIAYYFHWSQSEIWNMNGRERKMWISQIDRIHQEAKAQRERELFEHSAQIIALQNEENLN